MKILCRSLALVLLALPFAWGAEGVLPSTNLAPQHLLHLSPPPDTPVGLAAGATRAALDVAYASVFSDESSGTQEARLDMEVARVGLRWARGLGSGVEVGAEIPWLWLGGGSFDGFIIRYHRALGLPNGDRDRVGRGEFGYWISANGHRYAPAGGGGFGDAVIGFKWAVPSPGPLRLATRGLAKLPTGAPERGLGSGSADGSLGAIASFESGALRFTGAVDAVYVGGTPDPALRLGTHWAAAAAAAAGACIFGSSEALVQLSYFATPYDTGSPNVDGDVLMLSLGMQGQISPRLAWAAGFTEDALVRTSPDFGVFLSLEATLDGSRSRCFRR